jgi:ElaB/YqjD/DUF883 family membrane-anchored ribosome-binding protein
MASSPTEAAAAAVAEDFKLLRDDVAKLNSAVAQLLRQQAGLAGENVRGAIDEATDQLVTSASAIKSRAQAATSDLEGTIARNPMSTAVLAMMAGLLLGLWSRQSR